jgi:DNA topoisomerase-1
VLKTGRYGRFAACEQYPDCKHTESFQIGLDCPKDGCKGRVVEKVTRRAKVFYGCSQYPECDWASWDKPVASPCPMCGHAYVVQKTSKSRGDYHKCPNCKEEVVEP